MELRFAFENPPIRILDLGWKAMSSDKTHGGAPDAGETRDGADVPVRLPRESFREFSRRIDEQLARLVAQWAHTAAPAALRSTRSCSSRRPR